MERSPQRRIRPVVRCPVDWPLSLPAQPLPLPRQSSPSALVQGFGCRPVETYPPALR
jgi:hypothetical protein